MMGNHLKSSVVMQSLKNGISEAISNNRPQTVDNPYMDAFQKSMAKKLAL